MNNKKEIRKLYKLIEEDVLKSITYSKNYRYLSRSLLNQEALLSNSLGKSKSDILEKYVDLENDMSSLETEEAFVYGFTLASRLFIDVFK